MKTKEQLHTRLENTEESQRHYFDAKKHSPVKSAFLVSGKSFEDSLKEKFQESNFASQQIAVLHDILDSYEDLKLETIVTKHLGYSEDEQISAYIYLNNKKYFIDRYKNRSRIEKFRNITKDIVEDATYSELLEIILAFKDYQFE